jgi:hypothetical protein
VRAKPKFQLRALETILGALPFLRPVLPKPKPVASGVDQASLPVFPVRILVAVFMANILTMSAMNAFVLRTHWLAPLYAISIAGSLYLTRGIRLGAGHEHLQFSRLERQFGLYALCLCWIMYALPRSGYFLEPWIGHVIDPVCWDDYSHILIVNSIVNTQRYPPPSPFGKGQYLTVYYAAWMLCAFIYQALPFSAVTITGTIFLGCALYYLLLPYLVIYTCARVCRSKQRFYFLLYLIVAYSGIESIFVFRTPLADTAWWMWVYFGVKIQCPIFSNLMLWAPHHVCSGAALVLAFLVLQGEAATTRRGRLECALVLGALAAGALYSSIFVFVGALPFLALIVWHYRGQFPLLALSGLWCGLLAFPMLWIFLNHTNTVSFGLLPLPDRGPWFGAGRSWALVACALLAGSQLLVQGYCLLRLWRSGGLAPSEYAMLFLSLAFIGSTFVIATTNIGNDYSIRGVIVPIWVLSFLASAWVDKPGINSRFRIEALMAAGLAFFTLASINEVAFFNVTNVQHLTGTYDQMDVRSGLLRINMSREAGEAPWASVGPVIGNKVPVELVEKVIVGLPYVLTPMDKEFFGGGPFGLWAYQRWQGPSR